MKNLVCGVGTNDADYLVQPKVNGKQVVCPYYRTWTNMLRRAYSTNCHKKQPTYIGCSVCTEWHSFMAFRAWMMNQNWRGMQLDKDFLNQGNKVYGPKFCMFIPSVVNKFITDSGCSRGEWPIGVYFNKPSRKFLAKCRSPFTDKQVHLGYFANPEEAYQAWLERKKELQIELAESVTDEMIKKALLAYEFDGV